MLARHRAGHSVHSRWTGMWRGQAAVEPTPIASSTGPVDSCGQPRSRWGRPGPGRWRAGGPRSPSTGPAALSAAPPTGHPHPDRTVDLRRRHFSTSSTPPKMTMNSPRSMVHPDHERTALTHPGPRAKATRSATAGQRHTTRVSPPGAMTPVLGDARSRVHRSVQGARAPRATKGGMP